MSTFLCPIVHYTLEKHPNADTLSIAKIVGKDWQCVVKTSDFPVVLTCGIGVYIPIDAIADKDHPLLGFLEGKKVKTVKLRNVISQGVLLPYVKVSQYLGQDPFKTYVVPEEGTDMSEVLKIRKWQPPANNSLGNCDNQEEPDGFFHYTDIENWKNFPNVINEGDEVVVTEKIHGTNCRYGLLDGKFYIGTHHRCLRTENYTNSKGELIEIKPTVWHKVAEQINIRKALDQICADTGAKDVIIYGEIFGKGVQDLRYGQESYNFVVFDMMINGKYVFPDTMRCLTNKYSLTAVPLLYDGEFTLDVLDLRAGQDVISNTNVREGIVIEPLIPRWDPELGRVKLKYLNEAYLTRKGGTDYA
jgi:RNA ligase (TIGR02306 family)